MLLRQERTLAKTLGQTGWQPEVEDGESYEELGRKCLGSY